MQSKTTDFVAPLGQAGSGRLVFLSGASRITLRADPVMTDLARGYFSHPAPCIEVEEGTLSVHFRHFAGFDQMVFSRAPLGELRLNVSIPWEIEFRKGVSHLTADLAQLQLRALDILGGADRIRLALSEPSGTAYIYASGGISQGEIRAPATAGIERENDVVRPSLVATPRWPDHDPAPHPEHREVRLPCLGPVGGVDGACLEPADLA